MMYKPKTRTHENRGRGPVPMRRQFVRLILLQVINDNNGAVRLIPVLSKLSPSNLGAVVAEDRGVGGTLFPRRDFLSILTLKVDDINLGTQSAIP